jgi:Asp-tRNA(Asn)/Glu-tRNA(Gln) amidotransferase C subunit
MERALTSADVERLATLVDLRIPEEDLELLARALEAHAELVEPLLRLDPSTTESALTFDPSPDA